MLADEIKNYDIGQMEELAQRLRERLVTVVRETGGISPPTSAWSS